MTRDRCVSLRGGIVVGAHGVRREDVHIVGARFASAPGASSVTVDVEGCWIYPGLINAHDHLHLNALPPLTGLGVFPNAYRWMDAAQARRAEPAMQRAEAVPAPVRLWHGGLKNLLSGATTVVHHDPWDAAFEDAGFPVRVPTTYSWCHSLGLSGATLDSSLRYGPALRESIARAAPRWFIHLGEGTDGVAAGELAELDRLGALCARSVLVHATGLRPADVERVSSAGAWVVWCPSSNQALLGRTLDPAPLAGRGRLALGTDSRLSGAADLLAELRVAAAASAIPSETLFRLVTCDAAELIGRPDLGVVAPGRPADAVVVSAGTRDPYEALASATRTSVALVLRDGRPLVAAERFWPFIDRQWADVAAVTVDGCARRCARRVLGPPGAARLEPGIEVVS